ncbi:hypothetical protein F2Q69_00021625 [Brassica cretica]|uniref:Uncharacterized protein n=1 Tax=Brassica cretica TaxID=69181 RepID=A0A8S9Q4N7_BRACR|nr:hypothetical protein F2Q69_00021625 [Brassica cretica]
MVEMDRPRDQLGHPPGSTSLVRRIAKLDRPSDHLGNPPSWTSTVRRMAELERSCCPHPVRKASSPKFDQTCSCLTSIGGAVGTLRL